MAGFEDLVAWQKAFVSDVRCRMSPGGQCGVETGR